MSEKTGVGRDRVKAGDPFGKWTITGTPFTDKKGNALVECKCECGTKKCIQIYRLIKGKSTQCRRCAAGTSPTLGSFSNRTAKLHAYAVERGLNYSLNESNLSESFSIQNHSCALSGQSLTTKNSAAVAYDGLQGLTPTNTLIVSSEIKDAMGAMDAKTFIGLCQVVTENAIPPKETIRKNVSVREFFNRREQQ